MPNKKTLLIIGGVGCGLLLLCAICFAAIFGATKFLTKDATATANEFFQDLSEGKVDESYELTSQAFRNQTTADDWKTFVTTYNLEKNTGVSWSKTEVKNDRAYLEGKVKLPNEERSFNMELEKENGKWMVYGMKLL